MWRPPAWFFRFFDRPPRSSLDPTLSAQHAPSEPAFFTVQSVVTFSGANIAVSAIRTVLLHVCPEAAELHWVGLMIALAIALFIWLIGVTDPATRLDARQKSIGFVLAMLNGLTLYLASEGLLETGK